MHHRFQSNLNVCFETNIQNKVVQDEYSTTSIQLGSTTRCSFASIYSIKK